MEPEEELNATTFQTYLYLVKVGKPAGPRDVMRGANSAAQASPTETSKNSPISDSLLKTPMEIM
ncbi:MAG TPA: hypothetical protein VF350_06085 [Candidatus Bathyarchaeia archaeon]